MRWIPTLLVGTGLSLAALPASAQVGSLEITVFEAATKTPLPGATVSLTNALGLPPNAAVTSDAQGKAAFSGLKPGGGYVVEVFFPGYEKARSQEIEIRAGQKVEIPFNLREEKKGPFELGLNEDVTVTATRVETSLMKTSVAVTDLDQETLDREGVKNVRDMANLVPNMDIATINGQSTPIIALRGVRSTNETELGDPAVGVHLDGIYSPRMQGALSMMFDNERVEILRGPQGTLFGRNSTVGSINIVTAKGGVIRQLDRLRPNRPGPRTHPGPEKGYPPMEIVLSTGAPALDLESLLENDPHPVSIHTTRQYKSNLLDFDAWRHGREITKTLVESYAAHLQSIPLAPRTINQKLASVRWMTRKMLDIAADYAPGADPEAMKRLARVALVEDVKGDSPEKGRRLAPGELSALIAASKADKNKPAGIRDSALFALAWMTGLRREDLTAIQMDDLTRTDSGIDIQVIGKGKKARTVFVDDGALNYLMDWLDIRGTAPGALFCKVNKAGEIRPEKMSGESLRKLLYKRSLQAGLAQEITWHDFRRTFAGNLWESNVDGSTSQDLMGHATQDQSKKYDRRSTDPG